MAWVLLVVPKNSGFFTQADITLYEKTKENFTKKEMPHHACEDPVPNPSAHRNESNMFGGAKRGGRRGASKP